MIESTTILSNLKLRLLKVHLRYLMRRIDIQGGHLLSLALLCLAFPVLSVALQEVIVRLISLRFL